MAVSPAIDAKILENFLSDIRYQPLWRPLADKCADYYDGNQITPEMAEELERRGQPSLVHNLIAPTIDGVLGLEVKTRTDAKLVADDDEGLPVIDAMNQELHEAARISMTDRACADAFGGMIKSGIDWVEVTRDEDPFRYPYVVQQVHRNEMWWDWHSKRLDLEDCRWLMRRRWLDEDTVIQAFPKHRELIKAVAGNWQGWDQFHEYQSLHSGSALVDAHAVEFNSGINRSDWWDSDRKRALVYEVYYRVWDRKPVLKAQNGQVVLYDKTNELHNAAIASGAVTVQASNFSRMRMAYFVGPHKLSDIDSPHPHNKFPYVPFFGYREDKSSIPYGLVRRMLSPQDEINHRRNKLTWLLNLKRVIKDNDALMNMSDERLMDELHRADGVINLDPNRRNRDGNAFRVELDSGIAAQQFQVLQGAQKEIQDVAGVYSAFLGQESGATSGVAIDSLVEQGTVTLSKLLDNYKFARQLVHELLLANIVADIGDMEKQVRINVNSPKKTKTIVLNERITDEFNKTKINNSVLRTKMRVVIDETANTATYRQQLNVALANMVGRLPPEFQAPLFEMIVETSDLANRDEVLQQIRKISGSVDLAELSPEEQEAMKQQQEQKAQEDALAFQAMQAEVEDKVLSVKQKMIEIENLQKDDGLDAKLKAEQIRKIQAETKLIVTEVVKIRQEMIKAVDEDISALSEKEKQPEKSAA
jgi:hypothetical protein